MKALSIIEPYASLILEGQKHIETRSWRTNYRGTILIHASATAIPKEYRPLISEVSQVRRGQILCKADLVDCIEMTEDYLLSVSTRERALGFYSVGRFAWVLENVQPVDPVKVRGHLGLWEYTL